MLTKLSSIGIKKELNQLRNEIMFQFTSHVPINVSTLVPIQNEEKAIFDSHLSKWATR